MKNLPDFSTQNHELTIKDVMGCMYGLKSLETDVYLELIRRGSMTIDDMVEKFDRDRSTIQRALKKLVMEGLIYREQKNIKNGGYYYIYHAAPFDDVKAFIKESVKEWSESVLKWVDGLEE